MVMRGNKDFNWPEVSARCVRLRIAIEGEDHGAQTRFSNRLGVVFNTWNNIELGRPLSLHMAALLVQVFPGLGGMDWLYYDMSGNLSSTMLDKLEVDRFRD